jgi:hypothetical protein
VSFHVGVEQRLADEALGTNGTTEGPLSSTVHRHQVHLQGTSLRISVAAELANVRFLLGVDPLVHPQRHLADAPLLAVFTNEGSFSGVRPQVDPQTRRRCEIFAASVAQVTLSFVEHPHVRPQTALRRENLLAQLAGQIYGFVEVLRPDVPQQVRRAGEALAAKFAQGEGALVDVFVVAVEAALRSELLVAQLARKHGGVGVVVVVFLDVLFQVFRLSKGFLAVGADEQLVSFFVLAYVAEVGFFRSDIEQFLTITTNEAFLDVAVFIVD